MVEVGLRRWLIVVLRGLKLALDRRRLKERNCLTFCTWLLCLKGDVILRRSEVEGGGGEVSLVWLVRKAGSSVNN